MDRKFGENQRWVSIKLPNSLLELSLGLADTNEDSFMVRNQGGSFPFMVMATSDFESTYQKFVSNGVEFIGEPKKNPGGRLLYLKTYMVTRFYSKNTDKIQSLGSSGHASIWNFINLVIGYWFFPIKLISTDTPA